MKKFSVFLCSLALIFVLSTSASAVFFELDSFDVNLREVDPGLVLDWAPELTTPVGGNLNLGVPFTTNLFSIWTNEGSINPDDQVAYPISVDFYFTQPTIFSGDVDGETYGERVLGGLFQGGIVEWDGPSILNFGPLGDGELLISLSDEKFNWGVFGTFSGEKHGAIVEATFELRKEASPVPEPATMLLLGSGLLGLVGAGRKKFFKKNK